MINIFSNFLVILTIEISKLFFFNHYIINFINVNRFFSILFDDHKAM